MAARRHVAPEKAEDAATEGTEDTGQDQHGGAETHGGDDTGRAPACGRRRGGQEDREDKPRAFICGLSSRSSCPPHRAQRGTTVRRNSRRMLPPNLRDAFFRASPCLRVDLVPRPPSPPYYNPATRGTTWKGPTYRDETSSSARP